MGWTWEPWAQGSRRRLRVFGFYNLTLVSQKFWSRREMALSLAGLSLLCLPCSEGFFLPLELLLAS